MVRPHTAPPGGTQVEGWQRAYGDDYFSFWAGGCRCIVLNSSLHSALEPGRYVKSEGRPDDSQESLDGDLRQARRLAEEQARGGRIVWRGVACCAFASV